RFGGNQTTQTTDPLDLKSKQDQNRQSDRPIYTITVRHDVAPVGESSGGNFDFSVYCPGINLQDEPEAAKAIAYDMILCGVYFFNEAEIHRATPRGRIIARALIHEGGTSNVSQLEDFDHDDGKAWISRRLRDIYSIL